tara:strand:+ start:140 stop:427 length:288 start_codon:yes stop_codon:yes gene_type:complete
MLKKNNNGEKMIKLKITSNKSFIRGDEVETKLFNNVNELFNYLYSRFQDYYPFNRLYWENIAKEWFGREVGFSDNDTHYYFGDDFRIKLINKERA